ncbi:hypothetical protein ACFFUB_05590 [Algimonas porphyrae]|uniref:Uncharacterized protein n=1 Tax=Algimonas porphyrae TaxID=1128113 RepID=A0ABQ5V5C5_9PROT|nr:hypothetical protein [Algimonas porphyrae]GLQ21786.1 hypothetical protein GCM10007854_27410 [Algimonas porphyrae]
MNGLLIFRMATAWVTLALVVFVLWISGGAVIGRFIAVGVLLFGLLQWWFLRKLSHQMAAEAVLDLEPDNASR